MNKTIKLILVVLAAIVLGTIIAAALVIGGDEGESSTGQEQSVQETTQSAPAESVETTQSAPAESVENVDHSIGIDMRNFSFSVSEFNVSPGDIVQLNLTSTAGTHNFVIDEFNFLSSTINQGDEATAVFTVPEDAEPGQYEYYCDIGNHREQGMVGVITVE